MVETAGERPPAPGHYTTHDFSALNRHVDEAFQRVHLLTWRQRMELARRGAVIFSMVAGAMGLLAICLAFAYWLALSPPKPPTPPPPPPPVAPIVVVPPVVQSAPPPALADKPKVAAPPVEPPQPLATAKPVPPAQPATPVVYNFSKFAYVDYQAGKVGAVITGADYTSSTMERPFRQFCYMSAELGAGLPLGRQDIAMKMDGEVVVDIEVTPELAQNLGLTMAEVAHARTLCRWAE